MARYYVVHLPGGKKGMWIRQQKMHVGKWHVKTLALSVGLVLTVVYYMRMQTLQTEGGSRARRQELIVHAYGAKPYKSLPYTRQTLAQMRNKTASEERSKKKTIKKGVPSSSLSIAQIPSKKPNTDETDKRPMPPRNVTRKTLPVRNKAESRLEKAKNRLEQSKKPSSKENSPPSVTRRKESELIRNRTLSLRSSSNNQIKSGVASKDSLSASHSIQTPKRDGSDKPISFNRQAASHSIQTPKRDGSDKPLSLNRQGPTSNTTRSKAPPKEAGEKEKEEEEEENEADVKKSKDNNVKEHDEDANRDARDKARDRDGDSTIETQSNAESRGKGKEANDGKSQSGKAEKNSRSDEKKTLIFTKESKDSKTDQKTSIISTKSEESSDDEKQSKGTKGKNEPKNDDKDKQNNRRDGEKRRAGLAEDRPKSSPKKAPSSESKKKTTDIKLVDDSLDSELTANKTASTSQILPDAQTVSSRAVETGTGKVKENNDDGQNRQKSPQDAGGSGNSHKINEESFGTESKFTTALNASSNANSANANAHLDISLSSDVNSNTPGNSASVEKPRTDLTKSKDSDEGFYIEGRLHFDNGLKNQGVADMQVREQVSKAMQDPGKSEVSNPNEALYATETNDVASSIWNALYAVLDAQRESDNIPAPDKSYESNTVAPTVPIMTTNTPPMISSDDGKPVFKRSHNEDEFRTNDEYNSYDYRKIHDYGDNADSEMAEYPEEDGQYYDSVDDNVDAPEMYEAGYQGVYINGGQKSNQFRPSSRAYSRFQEAKRQGKHRFNVNPVYSPDNRGMDPRPGYNAQAFGRRKFGSYMRIPNNDAQLPDQRDGRLSQQTPRLLNQVSNEELTRYNEQTFPNQKIDDGATDIYETVPILSGDEGVEKDQSVAQITDSLSPEEIQVQSQDVDAPVIQADKENSSRLKLQALARAKMARYAALSAQNDPEPIEIKPLSRSQRVQQVHTIPL